MVLARLATAITIIGAKRAVLDTVAPLFARVSDPGLLRQELLRLFQWLKDRGITSIITGEMGQASITRHGVEEYTSDCVIALDQRVADQITTRRMRIVKYRGSAHGTNEYPFLIDQHGLTVVPITAISLNYPASDEITPTGIAHLGLARSRGYSRSIAPSPAWLTGRSASPRTWLQLPGARRKGLLIAVCEYRSRSPGICDRWDRPLLAQKRPAAFSPSARRVQD